MDGTMNVYTPSGAGDPSGGLVNSYGNATGAEDQRVCCRRR
jgi:hypothetical protein